MVGGGTEGVSHSGSNTALKVGLERLGLHCSVIPQVFPPLFPGQRFFLPCSNFLFVCICVSMLSPSMHNRA